MEASEMSGTGGGLRPSPSSWEPAGRTTLRALKPALAPSVLWNGQRLSEVLGMVRRFAPLAGPVLITGETGTGKELIARALHDTGPRAGQPFRALNCGAIPLNLLEGVLFGYLRGAFTGAAEARGGIFEEAGGGTVFLDEIGELSLPAQAALLRVLDSRVVVRLGSHTEVPVAARVVAATHRDLADMVARGAFREDLLHRLNTFVVAAPPLRERRDEIRPLAELFMGRALAEVDRELLAVDASVWAALEAAPWLGNVRELRNVTTRTVVLFEGVVLTSSDLVWCGAPARTMASVAPLAAAAHAPRVSGPPVSSVAMALRDDLRARELAAVRDALVKTGGHKARAAELLCLPIRTFRRRLREIEGR